ncbi:MAG: BCCT family transporter [Neisseriaceae bacterium]|nr:BCCT family transporter [Neisseriaceae bacterium]
MTSKDTPPRSNHIVFWGLTIHKTIFPLSLLFILAFVSASMIAPNWTATTLTQYRGWITANLDAFILIIMNLCVLMCFAIIILPWGKIRLGGKDAKPEYSKLAWFTMLFTAGTGVGLIFWGVAEPVAYYTDWYGTPLGVPPRTPEGANMAMATALFHWGLHPWSIYVIIGLSVGYFTYNRGRPEAMSSALEPLLGLKGSQGVPGQIIDIFAILLTTFALASSLGLGSLQAVAGSHYVFGLPLHFGMQVLFIALTTLVATLSVSLGIRKGIRILSTTNFTLAVILLVFVIFSTGLFRYVGQLLHNFTQYAYHFTALSSWINREDREWYQGWTVYYWVWWAVWAPLAGVFLAKVSKGRTLRQMVVASMIVPMLFSSLWLTGLGNGAIDQIREGVGPLVGGITSVDLSIFHFLSSLPFTALTGVLVMLLVMLFMVTSIDSGALVVDTLASGGNKSTLRRQKALWVFVIGLTSASVLYVGGNTALNAIQAVTIVMGLPLMLILLVLIAGFLKALYQDTRAPK